MEQDLTRLSDHTAVLRRRWYLVASFVLLGIIAGLALSFGQTPLYTAQTKFLLENQSTTGTGPAGAMDSEEVATQAEVVLSDPVTNRVIDSLGLDTTPRSLLESVTVEVVENKRVLVVAATRPDPEAAADIANAFAEEYVAIRQERSNRTRVAVRDAYLEQLSDIQAKVSRLRDRREEAGPERTTALNLTIQSLFARQAELRSALLVAEDPSSALSADGQVLQRADAPTNPSEPNPVGNALIGLVVGLVLGTTLAYLRDHADDGIRSAKRLSSAVAHTPVLGRIPTEKRKHRGRVTTLLDPRSPASEAYRALNTNIRFLLATRETPGTGNGGAAGLVMIASASPGEGKTTVATNLAVTAARVGMRVILVDADMRDPKVAQRFGVDIPEGLSDVLSSDRPLEPHLHEVGVPNLRVLAAGSEPPNPAELLASPQAHRLWQELRAAADLVIIDTAPILQVADPLELVREIDEIILVARERRSRARTIQAAVDRIHQVGGRPSGTVLNYFTATSEGYGYVYDEASQMSGT